MDKLDFITMFTFYSGKNTVKTVRGFLHMAYLIKDCYLKDQTNKWTVVHPEDEQSALERMLPHHPTQGNPHCVSLGERCPSEQATRPVIPRTGRCSGEGGDCGDRRQSPLLGAGGLGGAQRDSGTWPQDCTLTYTGDCGQPSG